MNKHLRAVLALPFTVTVVIPIVILTLTRRRLRTPLKLLPVGAGLVVIGLWLMARTIRMFATVGQGTLAPWEPTQKLVVVGIYRHVRNPMILGVMLVLLGEVLVTGSAALLGWFVIFAIVNALYMPLVEEPGLVRRFGADYRRYRVHVPRWLPRLRAWTP